MPPAPPSTNADNIYKILIAILSAVLGYIGALRLERFKNRLLTLKKKITYQLVGMSSLTETWGDIRITWNDEPVNNLYFYNVEIINETSRDAPKDFVILFSVEPGCHFFRESGVLNHGDVKMRLKLEDGYFAQLQDISKRWFDQPLEHRNFQSPLQGEVQHVTRHKKFVVPILNRKEKAAFEFLIASDTS